MGKATNRVMRQDKRENNSILICTMALILIGIVFVFSSSSAELIMKGSNKVTSFMNKQILYGCLGLIAGYIVYKVNLKFIIDNSTNILFATIAILMFVLLVAEPVKGARSWLKLGPFSLQPSEFAKITLILMTAQALKGNDVNNKETFKKIAFSTIPILILVVLQKDLGTVMIMGAIILAMMYLAGIEKKILGGISLAGLVGILVLSILSPYRMKRMLVFLNPFDSYYGLGYQIVQSLYAVATGGVFGVGLGNSIHKFGFLPENHTDFIFSIVIEEVGLVGATIVIFLFVLLITQMLRVAFRVKNKQHSLIVSGIASFIAIESLLNLAVVVSLMPVTGVTLPFISYGGSSLLSKAICVSLVLNINKSSKKTDSTRIDIEREQYSKKRQEKQDKNLNAVKTFGKNTRKITRAFLSNSIKGIMNGVNVVKTSIKEGCSKVTSTFNSKKTSVKDKKSFSKTKVTKFKKSSNVKSSKKSFSKKKQSNKFVHKNYTEHRNSLEMETINLDEVYLKESGFDNKEEYLNEIDLNSVDFKQFND